jgi:hypothetical protein
MNLYEPNTVLEDRLTQLDVRLIKRVRLRRARLLGMFDVYNVLNANTVTSVSTAYPGTSTTPWRTPTGILPGRLFKFNVQVDF